VSGAWEPLGRVPPSSLAAPRVTLHWAAQIVAAAGATWLAPRDDASHTALTWIDAARAFAGEPLAHGTRAVLVVEELSLAVAGADGAPAGDRFPLAGRTLADGLAWLATVVANREHAASRPLARPAHELPARPEGSSFTVERDVFAELARWYANAARLLAPVAETPGASSVRVWPHHFDIATLIALDESKGEHARSIGVGLSPGDVSYAEPYWYVTPWPYPPNDRPAPGLPSGHWHTAGWFGAVLTATELLASGGGEDSRRTQSFLGAAIDASRTLVAT